MAQMPSATWTFSLCQRLAKDIDKIKSKSQKDIVSILSKSELKMSRACDNGEELEVQGRIIAGYYAADKILGVERKNQITELQIKKVLSPVRKSWLTSWFK